LEEHGPHLPVSTWAIIETVLEQPVTGQEALKLGFINYGIPDGRYFLYKLLPGLWLLQECSRYWKMQSEEIDYESVPYLNTLCINDKRDKRASREKSMNKNK
jgi:hypothetical protein